MGGKVWGRERECVCGGERERGGLNTLSPTPPPPPPHSSSLPILPPLSALAEATTRPSPPPRPFATFSPDTDAASVNEYMSSLVGNALLDLQDAGCCTLDPEAEGGAVHSTTVGRIASFYYLDHTTMKVFTHGLGPEMQFGDVLQASAGFRGAGKEIYKRIVGRRRKGR